MQATILTAARGLQTRYYVDVHPPLAKLLLTFAAFVGGFDGNFDFKDIGK
jgi:dolichyl-phosphate-mannose-protein mannosyltransferase